MKINKIIFFMLCLGFVFGCDKKDRIFEGKDNIIASFQLQVSEQVFKAAITADSIIIYAPENISFSLAAVSYTLSEHATIRPEPSGIENWDQTLQFTVTSHNNTERVYTYSVQRNPLSAKGNIVLLTQEEVDIFAEKNIHTLEGNLTIGQTSSSDSIYSLEGLQTIRNITGKLTIHPTFAGKDLAGLAALESLGALQIGPARELNQVGASLSLSSVDFPSLRTVKSDLIINSPRIQSLHFPGLTHIDKTLQLLNLDSIESISFPLLESILNNTTIQGRSGNNQLQEIIFPKLVNIEGSLTVSQWSQLKNIQLPALQKLTDINIRNLQQFNTFNAASLTRVDGDIDLSGNQRLENLHLQSLTHVGGNLNLQNLYILKTLESLHQLQYVGKNMYVYSLRIIEDLNGLSSLETVQENLFIYDLPLLKDDEMQGLHSLKLVGANFNVQQVPFKTFHLPSLESVRNLTIDGGNISTIESIDLRGINISNGVTLNNITTSFQLKGDTRADYTLSLTNSYIDFATGLTGFEEVKGFSYQYINGSIGLTEQSIPLKKVNGNLSIYAGEFQQFSMPLLESVEGAVVLNPFSPMTLHFPALKQTGKFSFTPSQASIPELSLPALENVQGDFTIVTAGYNNAEVRSINLPLLHTVNGILRIASQSAGYSNNSLTNLNSLATLNNVNAVQIMYNMALTDYSGLRNALPVLSASTWTVSGNQYNPDYEAMIAGEYLLP